MKIYITNLLTALSAFWMILFLYGVSAGFASFIPIIALLSSVVLFTVATPIFIYNIRIGLVISLVCCLLILPYSVMFIMGVIDDGVFNFGVLLVLLPILLIYLCLYFILKSLLGKNSVIKGLPVNKVSKVILAAIPILLFIIYIACTGKYWSWDVFKI